MSSRFQRDRQRGRGGREPFTNPVGIEAFERADFMQRVMKEIGKLEPPKHQIVMIKRFGLDGKGVKTLKEVAAFLMLSRERIRQIERLCVKKIRDALRRAGEL